MKVHKIVIKKRATEKYIITQPLTQSHSLTHSLICFYGDSMQMSRLHRSNQLNKRSEKS
jgi:hypothetical protein